MNNNNLNITVTAGLDKPRSAAQINQDIQKIEAQIRKLKLQATLDKGNSIAEIQNQINALNKQRRSLYIDLKIQQKDLKRQYKQAVSKIQTQTLNVDVDTAYAQSQMTGLTNSVKTTTSETVILANSLKKALSNTGLVISSQTALQLVRKAAQEATAAVKEYDKYATNLSIITGGSKESSYDTIADLAEKSFDFKIDISELENAYETLLRTGKAAGELDNYLKSTVFLSKVGFEDMATSAENLVTIGNAFKLQSDEIENVVSSLVALDTASNTVAGKLSTAMGKTAQNAQLAGLSIDELGAIISGLRDTTGKTEDAIATSLNGILTRLYNVKLGKYEIELEDGSTENISESLNNVEEMLKTVGINIRTSKGEFRDITDIIDDLVTKWHELNDVQKNAVGFTFAGTYHKNTFIALVENWERIKELTEISADSAGQASEKYNAYLDSIEAKSAALSTSIKDLWNSLIPRSLVGDLTDTTTEIIQFTDKYQVLQTALKSAAFYAFAKGIITVKNSITGLVVDIKNVSNAMEMASRISILSAQEFAELKNVAGGLSDKQLKLILSTKELTYADKLNIVQTENMTKAEAEQKLATLGITQANTTAAASTFSLSGAFKALWASIAANPIGALTIAFTGLVTIYQTIKRKQEEQIEKIKETADRAKELTDKINQLYDAYSDMKLGVEGGTESKESLTAATNDLLKALGYEGDAVDDLTKKYGNLSDAINQATADTLENSLPDLANAVDAELTELTSEAMNHDQSLHFGFDIKADNPESKALLDFIKEYDKNNGGMEFEVVNSLTTRVDFTGDRNGAEGIKERLDNMKSLRQALFDKYGAENVTDLEIYDDISSRITELEAAYDEYNTALSSYNDTAAQAQIIQSLIGKEIPKTVDEYKIYRQELIKTAQESGKYIGSQEDISNAIDGTLNKMNEFEDIRRRADNLSSAYSMLGIDDNVNSAAEGIKKAFVNSLSDDDLSILVQLDRSNFDNGIESVKQAIEDFKSSPENKIVTETEVDAASFDELQKAYENTFKSADSFIKNQKSVTSALEEQTKHGQLSASAIRELAEAGYSEALVTDAITGAVTLDMQAYEKLNAQKQEKIRLDLVNGKNGLEDKLRDEQSAVSDLRQEYEALAKAGADINADRLSEITLELAKRGANIEDIQGLISQINGDITSLTALTFDSGSTDTNKAEFDSLYSQWNHALEMKQITEEEYIDWLDGAYKQYFSDLTKYQDEYNKYEEEVYKSRTDREQKLLDKKIDNLEKLAVKALDDKIDSNGAELTVTASFDYAREQINSAISEIKSRIDGIKSGAISGSTDDIESLIDDLDSLYDKLTDINKKEIESEKDYINNLKDEYSDMMSERIDAVERLSDAIEKSYDNEIKAIDQKIKAIEKERDAEERKQKVLEAQKKVAEAQKELDKASIKKYIVLSNNGWQAEQDNTEVEEAREKLEQAKNDLEDALQNEQKALLENQKDILEEQRDNDKDYYSAQKDALESQKKYQENIYDTLSNILDKISGDDKQSESNRALIKKLTKSGDINAAISELSETEKKKAFESGLITETDSGFELNNSALDAMATGLNTAFADGTAAINGLTKTITESRNSQDTKTRKTNKSSEIARLIAEWNAFYAELQKVPANYGEKGHEGNVDINHRTSVLHDTEGNYGTIYGTTLTYRDIADLFEQYLTEQEKQGKEVSEKIWSISDDLWIKADQFKNGAFNVSPFKPDGKTVVDLNSAQYEDDFYNYLVGQLAKGIRLEDMDIYMGGNYNTPEEADAAAQKAHEDSAELYEKGKDILLKLLLLGYDINDLQGAAYDGKEIKSNTQATEALTKEMAKNNDNLDKQNKQEGDNGNGEQSKKASDIVTAGGYVLVADEDGKLTKKPVEVNGKAVEGLGHKVNAVTKSEHAENLSKYQKAVDDGKFSGTFDAYMRQERARKKGIIPLEEATDETSKMLVAAMKIFKNNSFNIPVGTTVSANGTVEPDSIVQVNTQPAFNCNINIEGSADEKTVERFRNVCETEINSYFQYLNNTMNSTLVRSRYSK